MITESKLRKIIETKIEQDEDLGDQVGGSGHLSNVSFKIDGINKPKRVPTEAGEGWEIIYTYTIIVETEFTYYPDNPGYEYKYRKTVFMDNEGKIISELPKKAMSDPFLIRSQG